MRRLEKLEHLNATMLRLRNRCFQTARLDGVALLDLLEMEPGPAFGAVLRQIHDAILNETNLPKLSSSQRTEIENRSNVFYTEMIKHKL